MKYVKEFKEKYQKITKFSRKNSTNFTKFYKFQGADQFFMENLPLFTGKLLITSSSSNKFS